VSMFELYLGSETVRRIRSKVEGAISPYNASPPQQGILVLGYDGSLTRMLRTDPDGRLQVGVVSTANPPNLDIPLSTLSRIVRWGRDVDPFWVHGAEVTAPAAGTALVSKSVSAGRTGYIYGFFISSGEPNDFMIKWTSGAVSYSIRIVFPGKGSLQYVDFTPLNEGLPADPGTTISITNVNAGSAGIVYQARLLYVEL